MGRLASGAVGAMIGTAVAAAISLGFTIVDGDRVPAPLGGLRGNPDRGAAVAAEQCAACHGDTGAFAGMQEGRLRLAIIDLGVLHPDIADHAFYRPDPEGRTRLDAQMVEDLVAYLGRVAAPDAP